MTEICRGQVEDIGDIIDFGNYIFSQSSAPHDFKELLPKLYDDRYNIAEHHYLVKENNRIKAMVLAMPSQLRVCNTTLKVCGIGSVSVHKYARGSGYMKELMNIAVADMKKSGVQLSVLGGQRQRYEYFGYEPCGIQVNFDINSTNIRHAFKGLDFSGILIEEVEIDDDLKIQQAFELHLTKKATGVRPRDEFYDIACSWKNKLYVISCENGFLGYVSMKNGNICELVLNDNNKLAAVICAIMDKDSLESISIGVPLYEQEELAFFSEICENYSVNKNHSINIFDFKAVIKAYMELKATYSRLSNGRLAIRIEDETLLICVNENMVTVEAFSGEPDVCMSHLEAITHIFSPAGGFLTATKFSVMKSEAARSWFPLPIYLSGLDCV